MSDGTTPLLAVSELSAGYGAGAVLRGIDFTLSPATRLGLLGANGPGKSTLLRVLGGLVMPGTGRITLCGRDALRDPATARTLLGYAVDPAELPFPLTGAQYLDLVASVRRLSAPCWRIGDLPNRLELGPWRDRPLGECSLGIRTRFGLCAALLGEPRLVILDETLNGLDPLGSWQVRRILVELIHETGCSVILATHALEVVSAWCDRALFLHEGRIAHAWSAAELRRARTDPSGFEDEVMAALQARRDGLSAGAAASRPGSRRDPG